MSLVASHLFKEMSPIGHLYIMSKGTGLSVDYCANVALLKTPIYRVWTCLNGPDMLEDSKLLLKAN